MKGLEKLFMFGMKKQELPPIDGTGVLLFKNNMPDEETTKELTSKLNQTRRLIAADVEGGDVVNIPGLSKTIPPRYQAHPEDNTYVVLRKMKELGLNTNLAPVADINTTKRSFGEKPHFVADQVIRSIYEYDDDKGRYKIIPCLKHFPGMPSEGDAHHEKVYIEDPQILPYAASSIKANVPMIMMGHAICPMLGSEPSSKNPVAYRFLREGLGFKGVIITDSLDMKGAGYNLYDNMLKAFEHGADILLISSGATSDEQWTAFKTLELVVSQNKRMRKRAEESIERVDTLLSLI